MNDDDRGYTYRFGNLFMAINTLGKLLITPFLHDALEHLHTPRDVVADDVLAVSLTVECGWWVRNDNYGRDHEWRGPYSSREDAEGWCEP